MTLNKRKLLISLAMIPIIIVCIIICTTIVRANTFYEVSFIGLDQNIISTQRIQYKHDAELPTPPEQTGYTFVQWDGTHENIQADIIISAVYEKNRYAITFNDYDGTQLTHTEYFHGDTPTEPHTPTREGHTFTGWDKVVTAATDTTVYTATYSINQYDIIFVNYDESILNQTTYDYGSEVTLPDEPTRPSDNDYTYHFIGWDKEILPATENTTYTAQFEAKRIVCSYCSDPDHRSNICLKKSLDNGAIGRWLIPSVGVNVALYPSNKQSVCDAKDSACYFWSGDMHIIGDHWNQGFEAIKKCTVGTKAYMQTEDGKQAFICTRIFTGHNAGHLTDDNYNSIHYGWNTNGITCYTCNDCWQNITIVFFQPC